MARLSRTITIAGGGLAGLSLAAGLLRRGIRVQVHEAGSYPRHRVCGEFISGVERETLAALGIEDLFRDAELNRSVTWQQGGREIYRGVLPSPALGISRHRLDERLVHLVQSSGGEICQKSRLRREPAEGLVWATGRVPVKSDWLGLKCHFTGLELQADLEMHLGQGGYAGLARIESGRVNVCGLFPARRDLKGGGPELLLAHLRAGGCHALVERLEAATVDVSSFLGVAGFMTGLQPGDDGVCVLGDAERMIPPFTGNGMSMAFQAAETALEPLVAWSRDEIPWDRVRATIRESLHQRFRRRTYAAELLHPWLLKPLGRAAISHLGRSGLLPFRPLLSLVRR